MAKPSSTIEPDAVRPPETKARALLTLNDAAEEAGVCYRFLQLEIARKRLVATRLSNRIVRIRRSDWENYLNACGSGGSHRG